MQVEIPVELIAWVALILSIIAILIDFILIKISLDKFIPIIELDIENPPPYDDPDDMSILLIKNIGERMTPLGEILIHLYSRKNKKLSETKIPPTATIVFPGETIRVPVRINVNEECSVVRTLMGYQVGSIRKKTYYARYDYIM